MMIGIAACFEEMEDPRTGNAERHDLLEILMIALCSVLCGGQTAVDMAEFGRAKEGFLRRFLKLERGIPSHDTFSRVFRLLDPEQFRACFITFMARFAEAAQGVIAIDGKTLRHSFDTASATSALHMVSAWGCEQRLVLAQRATDAKSNEITAVPKLLDMLLLNGTIVTVDAMNCQRDIARRIIDKGGDYVFALKANHETLCDDVRRFLDDPDTTAVEHHTAVDGDHGRIETRTALVSTDIAWLQDIHHWPGLEAIGKVIRTREANGKTTTETAFYLASCPLSAECFGTVTRAHWGIENSLHWVLDVAMNEDDLRNRKDNCPENLAVLRHMALNIIRKEQSKGSTRLKFKRAAWNDDFLAKLLAQI
jgi:predicted transposase YbfD/YdcC